MTEVGCKVLVDETRGADCSVGSNSGIWAICRFTGLVGLVVVKKFDYSIYYFLFRVEGCCL